MTGKVVNSRFLPLNNFVASRQESAPKTAKRYNVFNHNI